MTEDLKSLSNDELDSKLQTSSKFESKVLVSVLKHLAEMDSRKYYRELGYPSLFEYCVKRLKYSESSAGRRIAVARLSLKFPVLELLKKQEVTLCALAEVATSITESNFKEIIDRIQGKKAIEVKSIVAAYKPPVIIKETIKPIAPKPAPVETLKFTPTDESEVPKEVEEQYLLKFAADKELMEMIDKLKVLKGDKPLAELMKTVIKEYITKHSPKERKESRTQTKASRYIPVATKDSVRIRDNQRCSFVSSEGLRCSETHGLEVDHIKPYACGGSNSKDNLRLLCRSHNQLMAEKVFGRDFINQKITCQKQE